MRISTNEADQRNLNTISGTRYRYLAHKAWLLGNAEMAEFKDSVIRALIVENRATITAFQAGFEQRLAEEAKATDAKYAQISDGVEAFKRAIKARLAKDLGDMKEDSKAELEGTFSPLTAELKCKLEKFSLFACLLVSFINTLKAFVGLCQWKNSLESLC